MKRITYEQWLETVSNTRVDRPTEKIFYDDGKITNLAGDLIPKHEQTAIDKAKRDLADACRAMWDLLRNPSVEYKICNGGRGNLGEHSAYHRIMKAARAALEQAR